MPFPFAFTWLNALHAVRHSNKGQSLTVRITCALQSLLGYVVSEQAQSLDNHLRIVVDSLCHVVRQVHLELEVLAVIGSAEQHAREVAFVAYFFGFDDYRTVCSVNIFGLHSLSNKLRRHQFWFLTVRTSLCLDHVNHGLEVLHILCVGHVVGLVIRGDSVLRLLKGIGTLF